jgi:hypothetical protein
MESYHTTNSLSSGGYSDSVDRNPPDNNHARPLKAYEFISTPPIQLILDAIAAHCGVGGVIRPGVRRLAAWANYASAGRISPLLDQLASDGWIAYDPATGLITLLEDPNGPAITERDRWIAATDDSAPITERDRDEALPDAEYEAITLRDRSAQCIEDHVLVAATETLDSAAARSKIPCGADSITERDHRAVLLSELGADAKIIADALAARPDLTPEQIRASWSHFERRIAAGLVNPDAGAFFAAIRRGQVHAPPRADPARPLDPESYADDPAYQLGSALPDEAAARNARYRDAHWRAVDLLGPGAAFGDMRIVVEALVDGATDDQALAELARELSEARR